MCPIRKGLTSTIFRRGKHCQALNLGGRAGQYNGKQFIGANKFFYQYFSIQSILSIDKLLRTTTIVQQINRFLYSYIFNHHQAKEKKSEQKEFAKLHAHARKVIEEKAQQIHQRASERHDVLWFFKVRHIPLKWILYSTCSNFIVSIMHVEDVGTSTHHHCIEQTFTTSSRTHAEESRNKY